MASTKKTKEQEKKKHNINNNNNNKNIKKPTDPTKRKPSTTKNTTTTNSNKNKVSSVNGTRNKPNEAVVFLRINGEGSPSSYGDPSSSSEGGGGGEQRTELRFLGERSGSSKNKSGDSKKKKERNEEDDDDVEDEEDGGSTSLRFPMARIKRIMKTEDSDLQLANDVVFLVNKATEKFIEHFTEEAYKSCIQDRKKSLAYKHLSSVVAKQKVFDFLSDYVPEKLKAEDALAQGKSAETMAD